MARTKTEEAVKLTHKIRMIFENIRITADDFLSSEEFKNPDVVIENIATILDEYDKLQGD